ncbi:MAG: dihydrofolate reductase [Proteobacteria bacterium]|nr:dihydrofolate reductase [Pseudomonadota bacterium]
MVACGRNNVIGSGGGIPWYVPADLKQFKSLTMGKPIIMGRKTYQSIGKPLPGRTNIVITRNPEFAADGIQIANSLVAALEQAGALGDEIMIIGGGEIYQASLPIADRIYMTRIELEPEGDVFFPAIEDADWRTTVLEEHAASGEVPAFSFLRLDRI